MKKHLGALCILAPMRVLTNLPALAADDEILRQEGISAALVRSFPDAVRQLGPGDVFLINCEPALVFRLCAYLAARRRRTPLIALDLVFGRRPRTLREITAASAKRVLLRRVDLFINYFRDNPGYAKYYRITPERSAFVQFKPSLRHRFEIPPDPDGEYVLCFGRSRRDYDTFFRAMAQLPYPAAVPRPDFAQLRNHGSRFSYRLEELPPNVAVLEDDGSPASMVNILRKAALVVLPLTADSLTAGVGVYLNAMLLGKCVIISHGPTVTDLLTEEAILVPPEDAAAVASAIHKAWTDPAFRCVTAAKGHRHALALGGQRELYQRVLKQTMSWVREHRPDLHPQP